MERGITGLKEGIMAPGGNGEVNARVNQLEFGVGGLERRGHQIFGGGEGKGRAG